MRTILVGAGSFGSIYLRNLEAHKKFNLVAIVERGKRAAELASDGYPVHKHLKAAVKKRGADCVVIATPIGTHADLICEALELGAHVMCAKPGAISASEAEDIGEYAITSKGILMIDWTPALQPEWEALIDGLGQTKTCAFQSVRVNDKPTPDVLSDLLVHDVAMLVDLVLRGHAKQPMTVKADCFSSGLVHVQAGIHSLTVGIGKRQRYVRIHKEDAVIAQYLQESTDPEPVGLSLSEFARRIKTKRRADVDLYEVSAFVDAVRSSLETQGEVRIGW